MLVSALCLLLAAAPASPPAKAPEPLVAAVDLKGMDRAVAPGDDFNAYASGAWEKATPSPEDKAAYGVGWMVEEEAERRTVGLIQEAADGGLGAGDEARKIGDFYASYLDQAGIEAKGLAPLKPQLESIVAIKDKTALARALGAGLRADTDPLNNTSFGTGNLMGVFVAQALSAPDKVMPYLMQGGLGMPDREFYLGASPHMEQTRKAYRAHLEAMFKLAGASEPQARAQRVYALEEKIAKVHATRLESEDVKQAVMWGRGELEARAPGLAWPQFLAAAQLQGVGAYVVWHPKAIAGLSALVASEPLDAWKDWLTFHLLDRWGSFLPKAFDEERFAFHGKALSGTPAQRPRWQRGVGYTSDALGEAIGQLYVRRYFPPEAKAKVQAMVEDLKAAFAKRIDALAWMAPETKAKAKEKLATLKVGVGYPDQWRSYAGLNVVRGDALGNAQRAELFEYRYQLSKLGRPVDRSEWWMTPQTVNAVNLPLQNALNFPAGILQPPFFDVNADPAYNFGSTGATIGHEISHAFDDTGAQFDAQGKLANWWTKDDLAHFQAAGLQLAKQYDAYAPLPDLKLNGKLVLGENIADLAGLAAAYDAYQLSLKGQPAPVKDGLTGDQRFFLAYAQSFREKQRDQALREQVTTDGHAPPKFRTFTVRNLDAWYAAFGVKAGKLFLAPKDRVRVW